MRPELNHLIGRPYVREERGHGYDCWTLVLECLELLHGVRAVDPRLEGELTARSAREAMREFVRLDSPWPAAGDVLYFPRRRRLAHMAYVESAGWAIEADTECVARTPVRELMGRGPSIWRHRDMLEARC